MLRLSFANGTFVLDVFVGKISLFGLITAFWVDSPEVLSAGIVVIGFISDILGLDSVESSTIVSFALLFLQDSKMFLLLMASTLCFLSTLGFLSSLPLKVAPELVEWASFRAPTMETSLGDSG